MVKPISGQGLSPYPTDLTEKGEAIRQVSFPLRNLNRDERHQKALRKANVWQNCRWGAGALAVIISIAAIICLSILGSTFVSGIILGGSTVSVFVSVGCFSYANYRCKLIAENLPSLHPPKVIIV